jgi:Protein of unknown function (DUF3105)
VRRHLRRIFIALVAVTLAGGTVLAGVLFFSARDDAAVTAVTGPGRVLPDRGAGHLPRGRRGSVRYDTDPPASGPHVPDSVVRDEAILSDDQILHGLELGNVVIAYGDARPPPELRRLAVQVAGPYSRALAASGQAVILARRPGLEGVVALAWSRDLRVASPADPRVRGFTEAWLGRGAERR